MSDLAKKTLKDYGIDPKGTWIDASGCTGLTELDAPKGTWIDARGCTGLTELDAPAGVAHTDSEIPVLKAITLDRYQAPGGPMEKLLTAGGVTIREILAAGAWNCHDWHNCPLHVAHGVKDVTQLPAELRLEGERFLKLFDGHFLPRPDHLVTTEGSR